MREPAPRATEPEHNSVAACEPDGPVADRGPQHSHVGRRRCAEVRDHEPAVVQLVRAQLGQYAGDLGGNAAGSPDLIGDLLALGMTALMALMMVIMRRHPDRPMTLAVGPVSCLQLVATGWVMGAQLDVPARELVLLAGFGVVHAAATVLLAEGVLRIRAAEAALLGALEAPLAPLWGWLILSEIPRMPTVGGGASA